MPPPLEAVVVKVMRRIELIGKVAVKGDGALHYLREERGKSANFAGFFAALNLPL